MPGTARRRTLNPRLARRDRTYTVDEVVALFGVHANTVRNWLGHGLKTIDDRRPILVTSTKRLASNGDLLECVGGGFGMSLDVFKRDRALHFVSRRYFWRVGPWRVPLPHLFSPGQAHVIHADLGGGRFRFTMTFRHAWLGTLFRQDGVFADEGGQS